jgi:DNA-directed RNA polymerase III subunit RPC2
LPIIHTFAFLVFIVEDAIILNKAAVDRGFGRCMVLRKHQTSVRRYQNGTEGRTFFPNFTVISCRLIRSTDISLHLPTDITYGPPDESNFLDGRLDKRFQRYEAVDEDGICQVGMEMRQGSVMVNKQSPTDTTGNFAGVGFSMTNGPSAPQVEYKPSPLTYGSTAPSYVDKVILTSNDQEQKLIKVMLRQVRRPEIGDKFASRHGQKGVCGLIAEEQDMPFNEWGQTPDLIMNPHGFPSRMTVGKLLELLVGKAGVFEGRQGYSSAFGEEHGSADTGRLSWTF